MERVSIDFYTIVTQKARKIAGFYSPIIEIICYVRDFIKRLIGARGNKEPKTTVTVFVQHGPVSSLP